MATQDKMEHEMMETTHSNDGANGASLSRQITVNMTPEHYERLFFQPQQARGDLFKRLANPTLMGLLGFLIPYTSTILLLCGFQGSDAPASLIGLDGDYYFLGAIAMNIAGICEFILGNTFPFAVFVIYGCHWGSLAYTQDPLHAQLAAFSTATGGSALGGATGAAWNSSQGFHNVTMTLVTLCFFIGSFRVNAFFTATFFGLLGLFAFTAAADFAIPHATTLADVAHITHLVRCAGGFGFIGLVCGWYLAILTACESTGIPCPLPVLDLSHLVFPGRNQKIKAAANDVEKQN